MSERYDGTALGTIALCMGCGKAIKLVRTLFYGDCWHHFTPDITRGHMAVPIPGVCDRPYLREKAGR